MVKKYKKKPVIVEAIKWTGTNLPECMAFAGSRLQYRDGELYCDTLEGKMLANVGDFIIKGVKGEFYPCKPDIFEATYDEV